MNRKSKSLFTLTGVTIISLTTIVIFSVPQVILDDKNGFCGNLENVVLEHELPISHPVNRCVANQSHGVSWSEWFTGRSSSYQFHFIDLLELLSRSDNNSEKNLIQTN